MASRTAGSPPPSHSAVGRRRWVIAEGYLPEGGVTGDPRLESHETACILNAGDTEGHVTVTVFFSDREPAGPFAVTIPPRRTLHLRYNDLRDPERIPRGKDFSSVLESDVPIVVQHTRLDSRRASIALLTTIAWGDPAS
jgi:hypothetical protein